MTYQMCTLDTIERELDLAVMNAEWNKVLRGHWHGPLRHTDCEPPIARVNRVQIKIGGDENMHPLRSTKRNSILKTSGCKFYEPSISRISKPDFQADHFVANVVELQSTDCGENIKAAMTLDDFLFSKVSNRRKSSSSIPSTLTWEC